MVRNYCFCFCSYPEIVTNIVAIRSGLLMLFLFRATLLSFFPHLVIGHHGAMFLAMNELFELFVQSKLLKTTIPGGTVLQTIFKNTIVKLMLCSAALLAALCEIVRSGQVHFKGHHGVAILALMKVTRCSSLVRDAWQQKQNKNKKNS